MRGFVRALAFVLLYPLGTAAAEDVCGSISGKQLMTQRQIAQLERAAPKSEYETSQAYETRIRKLIPNLVATSIEIYDNPILTPFRYDAEAGTLIVNRDNLPDVKTKDTDSGLSETTAISVSYQRGDAYIGENAFGAVRRVERLHTLYLEFSWRADGPVFTPPQDVRLMVNPRDAKLLRSRLGLLLVGRPLAPWLTVDNGTYTPATISSGVDASEGAVLLTLEPICASVYDRKTKRVYASWGATQPRE